MRIFFYFSDETVERAFNTTDFNYTQVYYNELEPADDSAKLAIPFDTYLSNKLKSYKNEDIKVQIKNGADNYITGYVRKTASFSKKIRNDDIEIEIVNPSYFLDVNIDSEITLTNCRVDSVVIALLTACKFTQVRNLNLSTVIPYFHMDEDDNIKDALAQLCKEYGYTYNFDNDGYFNLYPLFNQPSGEITQVFNGNAKNCYETLKMELKEEEADSITANWNKIDFVENTLIFSDTSNGDATYKCNIQVKPNAYFLDNEENYCNYDSTLGEVKLVTSITADFVHDDQIEVLKCINCGTKALVSAYNHSSSGQYRFTKFDIYGNAYIQIAQNTTGTGAGKKKTKDVDLTYLYDKDIVEQFVKNLVNYYRYADFTVSLNSKDDFPIGSFCKVTASGFGTITGRIIQKKTSLLEEMIQYKIEGISEFIPAEVKTVTKVPSSGIAKGDTGAAGKDGETIVCPDLSQCVFYFSMDDVLNNKLINNADTTYAVMNGCRQVTGLNGTGIKVDASQNDFIQYTSLPVLESITLALFVRASSFGIITQQTEKSYYIEMQSNKLILKPDPSSQITINQSFFLDTWYLIVYTYANDAQKETVYVYRYGVENGQYIYKDKTVTSFFNTRDFSTDWNDTYQQTTIGLASGIVDEVRLDSYAWPDNSADAYAVLKGTTTKKYTLGDYNALNLDETISAIVPKYLGAYNSDPIIANTGDWYAYIGDTTDTRKKGYCYYKLNTNLWTEDLNWDHMVGALNDLLSLTTDENVPAVTFLNKLVANEAFIKKLATQLITLSSEGSIRSENYKKGESGFCIKGDGTSEFIGTVAKNLIVVDGSFTGSISSGPMELNVSPPATTSNSVTSKLVSNFVSELISSGISQGKYMCTGTYNGTAISAVEFSRGSSYVVSTETYAQNVYNGQKYVDGQTSNGMGGYWSTYTLGYTETVYHRDTTEIDYVLRFYSGSSVAYTYSAAVKPANSWYVYSSSTKSMTKVLSLIVNDMISGYLSMAAPTGTTTASDSSATLASGSISFTAGAFTFKLEHLPAYSSSLASGTLYVADDGSGEYMLKVKK